MRTINPMIQPFASSKIRYVSCTRQAYSIKMYPKLDIQGRGFERQGFDDYAQVHIYNPQPGIVIIINAANITLARPPREQLAHKKNLRTSPTGHPWLELQGRWFWQCGFGHGDEVEIIYAQAGMLEVRRRKTYSELVVLHVRMAAAGRSRWNDFIAMLQAALYPVNPNAAGVAP